MLTSNVMLVTKELLPNCKRVKHLLVAGHVVDEVRIWWREEEVWDGLEQSFRLTSYSHCAERRVGNAGRCSLVLAVLPPTSLMVVLTAYLPSSE